MGGWVGLRNGRMGGRCVRYGRIGGRREKVRGVYRFSALVKQNKKAKICFVIHIAGEKKLLFYIYAVIMKQKIYKRSTNHYRRASRKSVVQAKTARTLLRCTSINSATTAFLRARRNPLPKMSRLPWMMFPPLCASKFTTVS